MSRPRRPWIAFGLAVWALLLGGCVYLRLFEFKRQLAKFDTNFTVRTDTGLGIICHTPIVRTGDIRWIGAKPETVKTLGQAEHWHLRMVKQLPAGVTEPTNYDILLELMFVDDKLSRVTIPEQYFAAIPKEYFVGIIRSFGSGKIDQSAKKIEATVGTAGLSATRPRLDSIGRLLGKPSDTQVDGNMTVLRYRFVPATKEPDPGVFDMTMTFDTASGELRRWHSRTPVGGIGFKVAPDSTAP